MAVPLGDIKVTSADDRDLELVAVITGLSLRTVTGRHHRAHGNTLLRNLFSRDWPNEPERLGACTVAQARDAELVLEIAEATGLSDRIIRGRLKRTPGQTLVVNAFPELDDEDDDEDEEGDSDDWGGEETSQDTSEIELLGTVRVATARTPVMTAWLAQQVGWQPAKMRRRLGSVDGHTLLCNALDECWPIEIRADIREVLGDLRLGAVRRSRSLTLWVARILQVDATDVSRQAVQGDGNTRVRNAFPGWAGGGHVPAPEPPVSSPPQPTTVKLDAAKTVSRSPRSAGGRVAPGALMMDRWRILDAIGERGGFGRVFRVRDEQHPDHDYVMKVADGATDEERRVNEERLQSEIDIDHRLGHHQNICSYQIDAVDPTLGAHFAVMKHAGESLETLIRRGTTFTVAETVEVAEQVAKGLDHAHGRGVVHQDLKPANILVHTRGAVRDVRICDWGIARHGRGTRRADGTSTVIATVVGRSPGYTAPEQWRGEARSASDQYCLALVVCSMLEGQIFTEYHKFQGLEALSPDQNVILSRALTEEPEDRFASCSQFVSKLRNT